MRKITLQIVVFVSVLLVGLTGLFFSGHAQEQQLRQEPRRVVPVPRDEITVDLWLNKQCGATYYQQEKVVINFRTDVDGYVTIYDVDTRGRTSVLFPTRHQPDNFVQGGRTYTFPDSSYSYDLVVEGPEGIEYLDAFASTDPEYHWNYHEGEPRWVSEWGLDGQQFRARSARDVEESPEYQNRPQEFGTEGLESLTRNFSIMQQLRDQVRSKLVERPRDPDQPEPGQDYELETCYFYVVDVTQPAPRPTPRRTPRSDPPPSRDQRFDQLQQNLQQIPHLQEVERTEQGLRARFRSEILFDFDSYRLRYEAQQTLDLVVNELRRDQDLRVLVAGHTDSIGSASYNQRLSEYRAQAVANYLKQQGIPDYRVRWVGYGEDEPVATNTTDWGRQQNRRVELYFSF